MRSLLQLLVPVLLHVVELLPHLTDEVHLLVDHVVGLALLVADVVLHLLYLETKVVVLRHQLVVHLL